MRRVGRLRDASVKTERQEMRVSMRRAGRRQEENSKEA